MKTSKSYKNINLPSLSEEQLKEIETLKAMSDDEIDTSDIPEATQEMLASGHLYYADSLKMPKTGIHLMIDNDNLEWLKNAGKGYQPRLNKVLRWARLNNCPIEKM
ncbi:MAG: BrnA antitoxin family protein [Erysipelotrichaceae bacterium]|nr:BrnA antitoxin family protein [Erysipelotrichaceae bacterium]